MALQSATICTGWMIGTCADTCAQWLGVEKSDRWARKIKRSVSAMLSTFGSFLDVANEVQIARAAPALGNNARQQLVDSIGASSA